MKLSIQREALLTPLQAIIGVVEKRHTMAILSNVLLVLEGDTLKLTATDLEVELVAHIPLSGSHESASITVPARKFFDIIKSLPDEAMVHLVEENNHVLVSSGRSRFSLAPLAAKDFPNIEGDLGNTKIQVSQKSFYQLLRRTYFAMAQQDVRYFLNGMLLELSDKQLRVVATDGHRLAMTTEKIDYATTEKQQVIVPRKAIIELMRLVEEVDDPVEIILGKNHLRAVLPEYTFTSKLLDGRYPDYNRVVPAPGPNVVTADKAILKQALLRTAILSNEKYRGVRLYLAENALKLVANNPEQEEAQDEIEVQYQGQSLEIGFNVSYLLDVLNAVEGDKVKWHLSNANSSALIQDPEDKRSLYVVMPIRL